MNPLIINVALTGMVPTKEDNRNVPITPEEIAEDAARCFELGARIAHVHARTPKGEPTWRGDLYKEIVDRIKQKVPAMLVCVSTSGRLWSEFDKRVASLESGADLASLTMGSMNFPTGASENNLAIIKSLALRMFRHKVKPELEIFEPGMAYYAAYLYGKKRLDGPLYANILLGNLGTSPLDLDCLTAILHQLPDNTVWSLGGIGRYQFQANCLGIALGGHVRVGLEDALWMDGYNKVGLADNASLVERVVRVATEMEREIATPQEVRGMLCLS